MPDLVTTAKGIAGGLPLAAVTGRAEIMDAVHVGGLGGTYGGNPVACAAALGAIEDDARAGPRGRARAIGDAAHQPAARPSPTSTTCIGDVRGRGAMMAVELVGAGGTHARPGRAPRPSPRPATPQGVVTLTCGTYGNVLRFLPPLAITDDLLAEALDVFEAGARERDRLTGAPQAPQLLALAPRGLP